MVTVKEDAEHEQEWWLREDPKLEQEWLRQKNLSYVGLIAIGVYLVQPFLTAASLDLSAKICVVAFSVAIPLLAALVMVNWQEAFRRRRTKSRVIAGAQAVAQLCAFAGVVAGFWHILWIAGVGILRPGWWRWRFTRPAT
jgi:ABC-type xylose transport system permease subunit